MQALRWLAFSVALALPSAALAEGGKDKDKEAKAEKTSENQTQQRMKANIVPTVAGIEVADKAAATIYELAALETLDTKNAKKSVQLAEDGIDLAMGRADALGGMKNLSSDVRAEASTLKTKLKDARTALQRIDKKVAGKVQRNDMEQIREHAQTVHRALVEAEAAVEQIARAHDVSTDLEFGG